MPDVFLSYSREDQATARRFAEALQREGLSVWWDQTLAAGDSFDEVTEKALQEARAVVVLWSTHSVTSRWVRAEAAEADEKRTLVPVQIEPCNLPIKFKLTQTADLSGWEGDARDPRWQALMASIRRYVSGEPQVAPPALSAPALSASTRDWRRRIAILAIIAGVVIALGSRVWLTNRDRPDAPATATPAATRTGDVSIAVLPFLNMSSDPEQEYFSDGLSEELLNQLAQVPELRVIGRTSSFAFKGKTGDLRQIGETLGATHLLEGSVRKAGNRVKITAQLINAADGVHLWSQDYERTLDDIFAIQDEIARTVAKQLELKLGTQQLRTAGTKNVAAFEALLTGRKILRSSGGNEMWAAVPHLERAVKLDPQYVTAWLWLADAYTRLAFDPQRTREAYAKQDAVIDEVVRLAPGTPEASLALSYRASLGRDLQELERLLREALQVPGELGQRARMRLSQFLTSTGRPKPSLDELLKVRESDPLDVFVQSQLPTRFYAVGDRVRGDQETQRLRELQGGDTAIMFGTAIIEAMGNGDLQAVARLQREQATRFGNGSDAFVDALPNNKRRALEILQGNFEAQSAAEDAQSLSRTMLWAEFLGDRELALQAALAMVSSAYNFETVSGALWRKPQSALRADPRFKEVFRKLGLVDYWRATGNWGDFCKPVGNNDFECH